MIRGRGWVDNAAPGDSLGSSIVSCKRTSMCDLSPLSRGCTLARSVVHILKGLYAYNDDWSFSAWLEAVLTV